jgi:hypothetical protein
MNCKTITLDESLSILKELGVKLYSKEVAQERLQYWEYALSKNNPYWNYGEAQGFVLDTSEAKSHIIASHDKRLAGIGFLGFYESDFSQIGYVVEEAEKWLRSRGCKKIIGPFDFSILHRYRFNEKSDWPVFRGEPTNLDYYQKQFENVGFVLFNHYMSGIRTDYNTILPYTEGADVLGDFKIRTIDLNDYENELRMLHSLQMKVFSGTSEYFVPFSVEEFLYWYLPLKDKINPRYVEILMSGDDPVGFCYSFVEGDKLIMKTIGLIPEMRNTGASRILIYSQHKKAFEDNLKAVIYALIRTGNVVSKMPYPGVEIFRNYFTMIKI